MEPAVVSAIAAVIGTAGAAYAGWSARKKVGAEADKTKAERDGVIVQSATAAVSLANSQMASVMEEMTHLRHTVEQYKAQLEKAMASEMLLRQEIGRVKKRVTALEEYIVASGLPLPHIQED